MLDIHNHTLFGVDDGAESLEISIAMLKEAKKQQIDNRYSRGSAGRTDKAMGNRTGSSGCQRKIEDSIYRD